MKEFLDMIEAMAIPEWLTLFDVILVSFATFGLGLMLGHMLGKR
jgi:hypothetical protein